MAVTLFKEEAGLDTIEVQDMFAPSGHRSIAVKGNPAYERKLMVMAKTMAGVMEGRLPDYAMTQFVENQSSEDFQWYMGDILQRRVYAQYRRLSGNFWRPYVREDNSIRDFRKIRRLWMDSGPGPAEFLQERENYRKVGVTGDYTEYQIAKYGLLMGLTWEANINDDLNMLQDFPARLAGSAVQTEDKFVAELFASDTGPKSDVFSADGTSNTAANKEGASNKLLANADTGTAADNALSLYAIEAGVQQMRKQTVTLGDDKLPLVFERIVLVIPQNLQPIANHIFAARELRSITAGAQNVDSGGETQLIMGNFITGMVGSTIVNPWLDILDPDTRAWYLFAIPTNARPGIEVGRLARHSRPQLFMKAPDSRAIGSGDVSGSFYNDEMEYKMRGTFGGTVIDPKQMLASLGNG